MCIKQWRQYPLLFLGKTITSHPGVLQRLFFIFIIPCSWCVRHKALLPNEIQKMAVSYSDHVHSAYLKHRTSHLSDVACNKLPSYLQMQNALLYNIFDSVYSYDYEWHWSFHLSDEYYSSEVYFHQNQNLQIYCSHMFTSFMNDIDPTIRAMSTAVLSEVYFPWIHNVLVYCMKNMYNILSWFLL